MDFCSTFRILVFLDLASRPYFKKEHNISRTRTLSVRQAQARRSHQILLPEKTANTEPESRVSFSNHKCGDGYVQKSIHCKLVLNKSGNLITKMAAHELREITPKGWQSQTLGDGTAHQLS